MPGPAFTMSRWTGGRGEQGPAAGAVVGVGVGVGVPTPRPGRPLVGVGVWVGVPVAVGVGVAVPGRIVRANGAAGSDATPSDTVNVKPSGAAVLPSCW